jgi:hypothetical protein
MTRTGSYLLVLVLLTGAGCIAPMTNPEEESQKLPLVNTAAALSAAPPIVTPDEVNETNAVEKAAALARELDAAANERPAPAPPGREVTTK